jgi:hypothetical protein
MQSARGAKNLIFVFVGFSLRRAERELVAYIRKRTVTQAPVIRARSGPTNMPTCQLAGPLRKPHHNHCGQDASERFVMRIRIPCKPLSKHHAGTETDPAPFRVRQQPLALRTA